LCLVGAPIHLYTLLAVFTGYTQTNGVVSKVNKNIFLTLHGHNVHRQQWYIDLRLPNGFQQFTPLLSPICAMCTTLLIFLDLVTQNTFGEE